MSIPLLARRRSQAPPNAGMTMPSDQPPNELVRDKTPEAPSEEHAPRQINPHSLGDRIARWLPAILVAVFTAISLLRNGATGSEILVFSGYWALTLLLPGTLIVRAVFSAKRTLPEDLALGAATGLALEIATFLVLRAAGLEGVARVWWLIPLGLFVAVPRLRRSGFRPPAMWASRAWAWSMAVMTTLLIMGLDLTWFQRNPLPPSGGSAYRDQWWHLAIVHELMRSGPAQVPQVAGELFSYHDNIHGHIAVAAQATGISPTMILFRLVLPPLILVAAGLIALLASEVSRRSWTGPVAVWLTLLTLSGGYLWAEFGNLSTTPLRFGSPTQMLAVPLVMAAAWALITLIRGSLTLRGWAWLGLIVVVGAGSKPTVVPTLLAGTLVALVAVVATTRRFPRAIAIATAGLVAVQLWAVVSGPDRQTGITVLGSLRLSSIFREISGDITLRGTNDGFVLDSLATKAGVTAAAVTAIWLLGSQAIRLIGLTALAYPATRRDPAAWWLAGALSAGWFAFLAFDLSSGGQLYFFHLSLPFGAVLTSWMVVAAVDRFTVGRRIAYLSGGMAVGAAAAIAAVSAVSAASRSEASGSIDHVLLPIAVVLSVAAATTVGWRYLSGRLGLPAGWLALALAFAIGISLPTSLGEATSVVYRWAQPIQHNLNPDSFEYLSPLEQQAMVWLNENSSRDDIIATNAQCLPVRERRICNAIGFWVGGISGRRVVLEGWGYTPQAHAAHGVDGKHRNQQPPPWPDRYELSHAAVEEPTPEVLEELRERFGATWLVAVRRAGPVSERLDDLAELAFENADVAIYRIG